MALSSARGRISILSTDTVGTTKTVSGLSFQPQLILFMWNGRTGGTDAVGRASIRRGFGAATSTSDRRAVTNTSLDAAGTADGGAYHSNAAVAVLVGSTGGSLDAAVDLNAVNSDGFQLIVDDQAPVDFDIYWIAIGGEAGASFVTFQFQAPGTTGVQSQDITSLSFEPEGLLFFGIDLATAPAAGVSTNIQMFLGASDGTSNYIWHGATDESSNTMDTQAYCREGDCIVFNDGTGGKTLNGRAHVTAMLSNGFTLQWDEHATINRYIHGVAIRGIQFAVFDNLTRTDGNDIVESVGFAPQAGLVVSASRAASTSDTPTAHCRLSLGMIVSATDRMAMSMLDEDAIGTSETSTGVEFDECYQNISTGSATDGLMDVKSVDSGGYTFVMDDTDPAQSFFWGVAFGDAPAGTTLTPLAVSAAYSISAPTVVKGAITVTPGAISAAYSVSAPTLIKGAITLTPSATSAVYSIPTPSVGDGGETLTPDVVSAAWSVSAPTTLKGPVFLTPAAAAAALGIATPALLTGPVTLLPNPVVGAFSVQAVTIPGTEMISGRLCFLVDFISPASIA